VASATKNFVTGGIGQPYTKDDTFFCGPCFHGKCTKCGKPTIGQHLTVGNLLYHKECYDVKKCTKCGKELYGTYSILKDSDQDGEYHEECLPQVDTPKMPKNESITIPMPSSKTQAPAQNQSSSAQSAPSPSSPGPQFCVECGTKRGAGKFCPECGGNSFQETAAAPTVAPTCSCGVSSPNAKFCPGCGKSKSGAISAAQSQPQDRQLPGYKPIDHTTMHIPQNKIQVGQNEKPRGLPKYKPPDHNASGVPVVKEVADGCYEGKYGFTTSATGK